MDAVSRLAKELCGPSGRSVPIADFFLRRSDRHRKESSHLTDPNNAEAPKRKAANDAEDARPSACVHKSSPSPTRTEVVDDEDEDMPDLVSVSDSEDDGSAATYFTLKQNIPQETKIPFGRFLELKDRQFITKAPSSFRTGDIVEAITAGLAKLKIHTDKALVSDYPLIGAVLHPAIHLSYFQSGDWEEEGLASRAKIVLEHLYDVYKEEPDEKEPTAATKTVSTAKTTSPSKGIWRRALATASSSTAKKT
ncbi:hypothetical protein B0H13DRAFT_2336411 [Mycena leptocephala]|nr:hypothetical protein B0H13DRAFT_2336411 [Mycena leptocephala]